MAVGLGTLQFGLSHRRVEPHLVKLNDADVAILKLLLIHRGDVACLSQTALQFAAQAVKMDHAHKSSIGLAHDPLKGHAVGGSRRRIGSLRQARAVACKHAPGEGLRHSHVGAVGHPLRTAKHVSHLCLGVGQGIVGAVGQARGLKRAVEGTQGCVVAGNGLHLRCPHAKRRRLGLLRQSFFIGLLRPRCKGA